MRCFICGQIMADSPPCCRLMVYLVSITLAVPFGLIMGLGLEWAGWL